MGPVLSFCCWVRDSKAEPVVAYEVFRGDGTYTIRSDDLVQTNTRIRNAPPSPRICGDKSICQNIDSEVMNPNQTSYLQVSTDLLKPNESLTSIDLNSPCNQPRPKVQVSGLVDTQTGSITSGLQPIFNVSSSVDASGVASTSAQRGSTSVLDQLDSYLSQLASSTSPFSADSSSSSLQPSNDLKATNPFSAAYNPTISRLNPESEEQDFSSGPLVKRQQTIGANPVSSEPSCNTVSVPDVSIPKASSSQINIIQSSGPNLTTVKKQVMSADKDVCQPVNSSEPVNLSESVSGQHLLLTTPSPSLQPSPTLNNSSSFLCSPYLPDTSPGASRYTPVKDKGIIKRVWSMKE